MAVVASHPQHLSALAEAQRVRAVAAKQRRELTGSARAVLLPTLIDPPAELATYRLGTLFAPPSHNASTKPLIRGIGKRKLSCAMREVESRREVGRQLNTQMRLRDLTEWERRALAEALLKRAPKTEPQSA